MDEIRNTESWRIFIKKLFQKIDKRYASRCVLNAIGTFVLLFLGLITCKIINLYKDSTGRIVVYCVEVGMIMLFVLGCRRRLSLRREVKSTLEIISTSGALLNVATVCKFIKQTKVYSDVLDDLSLDIIANTDVAKCTLYYDSSHCYYMVYDYYRKGRSFFLMRRFWSWGKTYSKDLSEILPKATPVTLRQMCYNNL